MFLRHRFTAAAAIALLAAGSAAADWNSGRDLFNQGRFDEAAGHFRETVESNPNWAPGFIMLGRCQLAMNDDDGALESFQTAVALDPDDPTNVVLLSRTLLKMDRFDQAREQLDGLSDDDLSPDWKAEVTRMRAVCLLGEDRASEAVAVLEERIAEDPKRAALHRAMAAAHRASGDSAAAVDDLDRAFTLDPSDHTSGRAGVTTALVLAAETDDSDLAARYREHALEMATRLAAVSPEFDSLALAGRAAFEAGRFDAAADWFSAAVEIRPRDPRARYDLGRSLAALDQRDEAINEMRTALDRSPDDELARRIHGQLARLLTSELELANAARHYRAAGKTERAEQIDEIAAGFSEALERLATLRASIAELAHMEAELESFGDEKGVEALADQRAVMDREVAEIEENLSEVRVALSR